MTVEPSGEGEPQPFRFFLSKGILAVGFLAVFFASKPAWIIDADRTVTLDLGTEYLDPIELGQRELANVAIGIAVLCLVLYYFAKPKRA